MSGRTLPIAIVGAYVGLLLCSGCSEQPQAARGPQTTQEAKKGKGITFPEVKSPDEKRVAQKLRQVDGWYVVLDGKASPRYEDMGLDPPTFSPNSKRLAYVIRRSGKAAAVVDEVESQFYDEILSENVYIPPANGRPGYIGYRQMPPPTPGDNRGRLGLVFSPDSSRLAYFAWIDKNQLVFVEDDKRGPVVEGVGSFGILFSPDSKRIAYLGKREGKWHVVIDHKFSAGYTGIDSKLQFSPDWRTVKIKAQVGEAWKSIELDTAELK